MRHVSGYKKVGKQLDDRFPNKHSSYVRLRAMASAGKDAIG